MIVNNTDDLLPLGAKPAAPPAPEDNPFAVRVADTFDSVELLLAARIEAEAAEARAAAQPETKLPFARETQAGPTPQAGAALSGNGFAAAAPACDEDSPAPRGVFGGDLASLADARGVGVTTQADYLMTDDTLLDSSSPLDSGQFDGGESRSLADIHIDELLRLTVRAAASDLHLTVGLPPMVRRDGKLVPLHFEITQERDAQRIVYDILNNHQIEHFERTHELDFSYGVKGVGRFRFNVYKQRSFRMSCRPWNS